MTTVKLRDVSDVIGLTLDHSEHRVLTGDSSGSLSMVNVDNERVHLEHTLAAHNYEIWGVHIDRTNDNVVFSGADDSLLKAWDWREARRQDVTCKTFAHQKLQFITIRINI